ncbi:acyltransferase family protein [Pseudogemmobacter humi]|uniref:Acyltransferase family protein n=1 Tax=Pseudogemmobacter humi TaxID=2483812 RepID=A0A3P5XXJ5_9RHOB|nr:acyltransferase family protein [Pseudogemmobacter humi]VDC33914.1 Acyltransferase family protein [Pseudogemmobacter humi]
MPQNQTTAPYEKAVPDRAQVPGSETGYMLRGMLILLVLFGHALQFISHGGRDTFWEDPLFRGIYMFHMPLFMALAGYFSPPGRIAPNDLLARSARLLWPMLTWAALAALLKAASQDRWPALAGMTLGGFLNLYWFLWALVMALALVALGSRLGRGGALLYGLVFAFLLSPAASGVWLVLPLFAFTLPFFLAGRLWRSLELQAAWRRRQRVWQRRSRQRGVMALWGPALIALPVAGACFLIWDPGTYAYNNRADLLKDPFRVTLMFTGAASATLVAGRLLWRLAQSLTGSKSGQALARCGRISLRIYLAQDLAFACLRAVLPHIPGAGSTDRLTQILVAALITGLLAGAITLFWRGTAGVPWLSRLLWGRAEPERRASAQPLAPCPLA